ncbi:arsenate reductase/protein-tyrosine-phosphatase family protein [Curtobacterium ammoniigenes]|uniref:arsenate reductase/protein-tyrosine-phosphatase family protein n=1 Tax=Curtobacterium ammoniigenes TaxID=395387 RepID=UPI0008363619|nr:hypothetical protein [Curtobacterium ammoniigenes]
MIDARFSVPWLAETSSADRERVRRVLVVCTANEARSPLVAGLLNHAIARSGRRGSATSAGTRVLEPGRPMAPVARRVLARAGVPVRPFHSRQLTAAMIGDADLVLVAEEGHRRVVLDIDPSAVQRTHLILAFAAAAPMQSVRSHEWELEDPVGAPADRLPALEATVVRATLRIAERIVA